MGLKRICERIDIDTWKKIADRVQYLNIYDFSDREFYENLFLLRNYLVDLNVSLDFLSRYPSNRDEIGLASLLQGIYDGNVYGDYKKANFFEKIYQLDNLGIKDIVYMPVDFPSKVEGISLIKNGENKEIIGVNKCFTDGIIEIEYPDSPLDRFYNVQLLEDVNYLINVLLRVDNDYKNVFVNIVDSCAILKNFNGEYPNRESILELRYPGLCIYPYTGSDDKRHNILKQIYYKYNNDDSKYPKKLVREYNNYHYE